MEWGRGEAIGNEPLAHPPNHVHIVINGGNEEVCQFYPHTCILHGKDGVEHHGETATTDMLVDFVAEGFQVDIGSIEIGQQVGKRLLTNVASRHEDVPQSVFVCQASRIRHIFYIGERLGIGVGDAWTMVFQTETDHSLWREVIMADIWRSDLRYLMVLTVQTTEITTCTSDGQTRCARMEMVQGLLFDGVDSQRARLAIDLADQNAVMIPATAAKTRLTIGDMTMVRTEQTLYTILV